MSDEPDQGEGRAVPAGTQDDAINDVVDGSSAGQSVDSEVDLVKPAPVPASFGDDESPVPVSSDRESALVGAAAAGSARAAARRSGARAGSTPAKGVATKPRDTGRVTRVGMFTRLRRFLREVVAELRKVIWPARNQMVTYTIVVIVFVVFMVALTAGFDVLFAKGVLAIFG